MVPGPTPGDADFEGGAPGNTKPGYSDPGADEAPKARFGEFAPLPSSNEIAAERLAPSAEAYRSPENHRFRKRYRKLTPFEETLADGIKDVANDLAALFERVKAARPADGVVAREIALAHTHLEDSVYRAIKGVTA